MTKEKSKPKAKAKQPPRVVALRREFDLAPLTKLDPEGVVHREGNDRTATFMLALALAFNDLKGILKFAEQFRPLKPGDHEVTPHAGEWRGLELQIHRLVAGCLHEVLVLLETFHDVATGPIVSRLLRTAPSSTRRAWKDLVRAANGEGSSTDNAFTNLLLRVRNNVAFHYYDPKQLVAGFRKHFYESDHGELNAHAYVSFGGSMEHTRFYYADAAVQKALDAIQGQMPGGAPGDSTAFVRAMRRAASATNNAVEHLLEEYTRPARRRSGR